jgi:antitoxin (DNA-binding transcriptional repressor) of toxin-antitoxin stability system
MSVAMPEEITEITERELERNFDDIIERVEAGETFIIRREDGSAVAMVPASVAADAGVDLSLLATKSNDALDKNEEMWDNYFDHDEGA